MFIIKAYAELTDNQRYTRKAIQQGVMNGGGSTAQVTNRVTANAARRTRTSSRSNYMNQVARSRSNAG